MNKSNFKTKLPIIRRSFVNAVRLERGQVEKFDQYPFCVPAVRHLHRLEFHPAVTFFVGENGSGKSTLLEAMAVKLGFNAEGGSKNFGFATRETHSNLHEFICIERGIGRPTDNYFLRAESFYNLATQIEDLGVECSYGKKSLHAQSHGEAFLSLLANRLQGDGIYLFDEPEAALFAAAAIERFDPDSQIDLSPIPIDHRHAFTNSAGLSERTHFTSLRMMVSRKSNILTLSTIKSLRISLTVTNGCLKF